MAENTAELKDNEKNWTIAQKAAGDAMDRVAKINADHGPEGLIAVESPIERGGKMIEREARDILNLVADKDSDEKPGDGNAAGTEGVLVPLKEYMEKHPKFKSLATAAILGTTLAMAACASPGSSEYDRRIEQVEAKSDSDEARAANEYNRERADLEANKYKYKPDEYEKRLAKIKAEYQEDLNRIQQRRADGYAKVGQRANDDEIRGRERDAEKTRDNAERTAGGVVDNIVKGAFGKGTEKSRRNSINNTLSRGARNAAEQIVKGIFK